ncbi:MAG: magnesium-translocating P-type ATPase [Thermodesulfovibrionales bacterium]|jgi:Mg2+-importing ATPase
MISILLKIFGRPPHPSEHKHGYEIALFDDLIGISHVESDAALRLLGSRDSGLTDAEAAALMDKYGPNVVVKGRRKSVLSRLADNIKNPLVVLLSILGLVSYFTGDMRGTVVIFLMVVLGLSLRFVQETRSDKAAEKLKAMVRTTATVMRTGVKKDIPLNALVPGDIVLLSAGDMVPADVRLISAKDLHVNQATLTGEAIPVEKSAERSLASCRQLFDLSNICLLGSNVEIGSATAVVAATGGHTYFGRLASSIVGQRVLTSFDKGVNGFAWLMIRFIAVMVPVVFFLNGFFKGNWTEAFLFALAVGVGLTPEMLPMIVTVNLSKGALAMSRKKVIVKRLNSIQNFGAMDVLCTDKTGTLTMGKIVLEKHVDLQGTESHRTLEYAYLNSYYQTGLKNLMDVAILKREDLEKTLIPEEGFYKIDEIPFDFVRRRMSIVVGDSRGEHTMICKGAVEEIFAVCSQVELKGQAFPLDSSHHDPEAELLVRHFNEEGFRVIALAYKRVPGQAKEYTVADESNLTLLGFLAFLDPPKETATEALTRLHESRVRVKILTGDSEIVTKTICRQVGLPVENVLLGGEIEDMNDQELEAQVEKTTIFAKLSPSDKERIIEALQGAGHVVGFLGDGINDAPALKGADVGISVDSAVDIAKESSDIILLEQSLTVLQEGVLEGRKVFGNIIKYIRMAASSNFGNMFSVLGASVFLPFLPMLPIQVLTNNLLYDFSQTAIPTDSVDREWIEKPRKWAIEEIRRFIVLIGPISSIFDYMTFFIMLRIFHTWKNPALFQTGWFVESVFTQTLIIHVIRTNKIPFIQSRASIPLILTSLAIVTVAGLMPFLPIGTVLGFVPLPSQYWAYLAAMLLGYIVLTQLVKSWYVKKFGG